MQPLAGKSKFSFFFSLILYINYKLLYFVEMKTNLSVFDAYHLGVHVSELEEELTSVNGDKLRAARLKDQIAEIKQLSGGLGYLHRKAYELGEGFEL